MLHLAQSRAQTSGIISIREARTRPLGSVVSVAGRITVANEFGGASYLQDGTAGLAVFDAAVHAGVALGDSVQITGPLSEFQATTGQPGTGLLQISGTGTTFRVLAVPRILQSPRVVTLNDINETLEGQLLRLDGIRFQMAGGTFQGNTNYLVSSSASTTTAAMQVRASARVNFIGLRIPSGEQSVVGVLSQFRGGYQLLPRSAADLGLQTMTNIGDTIPKSRTIDVTTWNVLWFGLPTGSAGERLGPADSLLQLRNVIRVLDSIDADVVALQEIANIELFRRIADSLPRYGMVIAPWMQTQRTAFLVKQRSQQERWQLDTTSTQVLLSGTRFGAGRLPFELRIMARSQSDGRSSSLTFVNIHADAGATQRDYDNRVNDALALYNALQPRALGEQIVLLGDFNDGLTTSIFNGLPSPYLPFVRDTLRFFPATLALAEQGLTSFSGGATMIDHVLVSNPLRVALIRGAERVENPFYIGSYISTTSDHFPVTVRFDGARLNSIASSIQTFQQSAKSITLPSITAYPNPAERTTTLSLSLHESAEIRIDLITTLGKVVLSHELGSLPAGAHLLPLSLPMLAQGMYWIRVQTNTWQHTIPLVLR